MVSVIDMPPPDESTWWRGKKGYEVGFFPSECVEVIGDKVPHSFKLSSRASTKPVFRRHGKLIAFFRSFLLSRPSRRRLKQSGILKERVFGCDLGEHLLNTGREIPLVLKCCTEFIEEYGIVDGIYRLSGVNSNIQRLRLAFDEDRAINLGDPSVAQDVHSVASLLKMYFRELPNPLLTYQLYDKFVSAVQEEDEDVRLLKIRDVVQQLPPPHYRTLQFLLEHLARIASHGKQTGMTPKNIAIVWAPNLLRSREVESGGVGALHVVGVQAVLTEYLIRFATLIFADKMSVYQSNSQDESACLRVRPKSLAISTPTKLLSLEEARARALSAHLPLTQQKYIEVGGGPEKLPSKYHTVIDLPAGKHVCTKLKKSPSGWKSFFSRGWYSGSARDKSRPSRNSRKASTASLPHTSIHVQEKSGTDTDMSYNYPKKLRTVKSAESLAHCLKEAGPIIHEDDKSGNSPKTHQQISMDSSYPFIDTPCSPFPRSPSLQRHTRSSSHESYFENSIDMASDPSVEDDSSLYYFVKEQMQRLQQQAESSLCIPSDDPKSKEDEELMDNGSKYVDSSESNATESDVVQVQGHSDAEKVIRKQKFCAIDGDPALAKVQRLSWMNNESSSSNACVPPNNTETSPMFSPEFSCLSKGTEDHNAYVFLPDGNSIDYTNSSIIQDNFPWLQSVSLHSCESADKPSICPSSLSLAKRYSCISSSDNEAETSSKIVVERYGNAETVLVEVHATQDTSSESESDFDECCKQMRRDLDVRDGDFEKSVCHSSLEETTEDNKLKGKFRNDSWDESFKDGLSDVPCSSLISHSSPDRTDGDLKCEIMEPVDDNKLSGEEEKESVDSCSTKDRPSSDLAELLTAYEDSVVNNESCPEDTSTDLSEGLKEFTDASESGINTLEFSASSADAAVKLDQGNSLSENEENTCVKSNHDGDVILRHPNEAKLENDSHDDDRTLTKRTHQIRADTSSFSTRSSTSEVHALRTKMENIPLHRKRQILNIPTPSSPIEEVRKKFELRATSQKKSIPLEHAVTDNKVHASIKESPAKLDRPHTEIIEVQRSTIDTPESIKRKSDGILSAKAETVLNKRHSEPFSAAVKINSENTNSSFPPCSQTPHSHKILENKISSDSVGVRNKPSLPSLFTQLKVRKLQSLQGESPTQVIDPWSDPILDRQEDYHPVVCFPEFAKISDSSLRETEHEVIGDVNPPLSHISSNSGMSHTPVQEECSERMSSGDEFIGTISKDQESECMQFKNHQLHNFSDEASTIIHSESPDRNTAASETEIKTSTPKDSTEDEAVRRERIERIKESRRAQLREKLKSESFRRDPEEKEKHQTKFRLRKDHSRQTVAACTFDSSEYLSGELKDSNKSTDLCEINKAMSTSEGKIGEIDEPRKGSETEPSEYSAVLSGTSPSTCDTRAQLCVGCKGAEDSSKKQSSIGTSVSVPKKLVKSEAFGAATSLDLSSTKRASGISVPLQPVSSHRESKFTSLTDVRDRVAMFERSKEKELCRAGPNGKFSRKQSASSLTPSFVS